MGLIQQQPSLFEAQEKSVNKATSVTKGVNMATVPTSTKIVTGVVRGSYVSIFSPRARNEGEEAKYSITLLIPKTDTLTLGKIKSAQEAAIALKWPTKKPPKIETTIHDGDTVRPSTGEPFGDECKGMMVMSASSKFKPQVVDRDRNEVIDPTLALSGDYYKISLNFFAYDRQGKRGVSAGLGNVLVWEKGQPLGGTSRASDDFSEDFNT